MLRVSAFALTLLAAAPAIAQLPDPLAPAPETSATAAESEVREKVRECAGEKFVFAWGAGARPTKVTLCSEVGASRAEVIEMIEDAAEKVAATSSIPEERRKAIVQQMDAKVAELKGAALPAVQLPPARPAPKSTPIAPTVAPLPTPVVSAPQARPTLQTPPLPKPRLTLECITPGEFAGGGPCVTITRDSILTVRAGEAVPEAITLRFVRSGEMRGEQVLGAIRKGQQRRFQIPRGLCAGISTGEAQIRIIRGGHQVDTLGPFLLRC